MSPFLLFFVALATASPMRRQAPGLDANNDGHIDINEVTAAMTLEEAMLALDTDMDQQFTVEQALQFIDHHYFNVLDTNHDHVLSFQELRDGLTIEELFAFYDRNDDGFLYGAEADRIYLIYDAVVAAQTAPQRRQVTDDLDTDGDGHLNINEVTAKLNLTAVVYALDTDGDMQFTVAEALEYFDHHMINQLDTNHDHMLSFQELSTGLTVADLFAYYDENDDGFLYGSEADKIYQMYAAQQNAAAAMPQDTGILFLKSTADQPTMTPFLLFFVALATASPMRRQIGGDLDANNDAHIDINEATAALDLEAVMLALDTDMDQMFTVDQALQFVDHHYFNQLDTDNDHMLSFQELRDGLTIEELFAFYDRNDDGFLIGEEADRLYAIYNAVITTPINPQRRQAVDDLDADKDGHLNINEVTARLNLTAVLYALDTDGDMQFTVNELLEYFDHHTINRLDTNHDHMISFQEILDGLTVADIFAYYDENDDGFLYGGEEDKIYQMYAAQLNAAVEPLL
ncbi:PREDICTED: uncharacterized protein LOC109485714 [Branchiostoma belcheri]|uniref:Uncharacterized protein LOC109485714 n=1 Tax=Branchiostoma belcheri TaxID=7741 RepID=A0A6P5A5Z0_BRABE|nr:PREDICTED: uncharacterized protein LOC109485714 [Branchiostoma belcheri]